MKKNRTVGLLLVAAFMLFLIPGTVKADSIHVSDWIRLISYNSTYSDGGIMRFAISHNQGDSTAFLYDTFCIEKDVTVWTGIWYKVTAITNTVGAADLNDTADYLFSQYKTGTFNALNIQTDKAVQDDLQRTLWSLQGTGPAYTPAEADFNVSTTGDFGTLVLNIQEVELESGREVLGADGQKVLYRSVPEAGTLFLLGLGLMVTSAIRRRKIR